MTGTVEVCSDDGYSGGVLIITYLYGVVNFN